MPEAERRDSTPHLNSSSSTDPDRRALLTGIAALPVAAIAAPCAPATATQIVGITYSVQEAVEGLLKTDIALIDTDETHLVFSVRISRAELNSWHGEEDDLDRIAEMLLAAPVSCIGGNERHLLYAASVPRASFHVADYFAGRYREI
jgi:hypothetical protein